MICKLTTLDSQAILHIVNDAARVYRGKIPVDRWKEPYMPKAELKEEIERGVQFYGYKENGVLVAVMGIQPIGDVTLIRHAYVVTSYQRRASEKNYSNTCLAWRKHRRFMWELGK